MWSILSLRSNLRGRVGGGGVGRRQLPVLLNTFNTVMKDIADIQKLMMMSRGWKSSANNNNDNNDINELGISGRSYESLNYMKSRLIGLRMTLFFAIPFMLPFLIIRYHLMIVTTNREPNLIITEHIAEMDTTEDLDSSHVSGDGGADDKEIDRKYFDNIYGPIVV
ncbi:uncharacterized protein LOC128956611 [Oppia nitens]|uniref:uncharacterized protein LOC128956611 n=1 Tax=Oppia nitens TaxID=1686743 RepID=UPI0023DAE41E|nr:uncharacterized protein LOC128956611 [Oppia nitens]